MANTLLHTATAAALAALLAVPASAQSGGLKLEPCRLQAVENGALCGRLMRPLDPAQPQGTQIELHLAVLPAVARNKKPDPVFFFAGGPGQSAIALAGPIGQLLTRTQNRRDVVLIDQRGTGRSAPLQCPEPSPLLPLSEVTDPAQQVQGLKDCRQALQQLPYGDLRFFSTVLASQDAEAVRQALGSPQVNLVGGSYGTRAALDYLRQFPQAVRRVVLDGVAPPDMVLPASFSPDGQAALEKLLVDCETSEPCRTRYPDLRTDWGALLASLPREVTVDHPVTGRPERFTLARDTVLGFVRSPLYAPALASALPLAITEGARGRFEPLMGLGLAMGGRSSQQLAAGMHFSVVCSEDVPRLSASTEAVGADFGDQFARLYQNVCADWPRAAVPAEFYTLPATKAATLVLSGGLDPATPPRHGARVTQALGPLARHVVVPHAGHGVMALGCMRDVVYRFIDAPTDAAAQQVDADCAQTMPRPGAFMLPAAPATPRSKGGQLSTERRP
jgi:pimeloyl-ACP methyl ester carboxylesterase